MAQAQAAQNPQSFSVFDPITILALLAMAYFVASIIDHAYTSLLDIWLPFRVWAYGYEHLFSQCCWDIATGANQEERARLQYFKLELKAARIGWREWIRLRWNNPKP